MSGLARSGLIKVLSAIGINLAKHLANATMLHY